VRDEAVVAMPVQSLADVAPEPVQDVAAD